MKFKDSMYEGKDGLISAEELLGRPNSGKFKHPVKDFNLDGIRFEKISLEGMAHHVERVIQCDLDHPIIVDKNGWVVDGTHRLVKCILLKREWVWVIQLKESV